MTPFEEEVNLLRDTMQQKFADFVNEDIPLGKYQQAIQSYKENFPEAFDVIQKENTDAKLFKLNELDFADNTLPVDESIRDRARYAMDVMYGVEGDKGLWDQLKGVASPELQKLYIAGKAPPMTSLHEGLHLVANHNIDTGVEGYGDELIARAMDFYRAEKEGNKERMASTLEYVDGQFTKQDLRNIAEKTMQHMYDANLATKEDVVPAEELKGDSSFMDKLFNVFK